MKQLFIQLNLAILLLSTFSFHCMGADKYTLKLNLVKGKTYKQLMVNESKVIMQAMGQEMQLTSKMEMNTQYDVIGQNKDVYDIKLTYQKFKMDSSNPAPFTIDSDSPENSTDSNLGAFIKSLIGIPVDIQMNQQGKIISIKGTEKLLEKYESLNNEQIKPMFDQQFSEQAIQTSFKQLSAFFPQNPVALNESWEVVNNVNTGMFDIINKMKLTLKQVKNNEATLEITGTISTPEGGAVLQVQGMEAQLSMNGQQAGTVLLDMKTGWIIRSEITQNSTNEIEVMGQKMQQNVETKVTVTAE